MLQSQASVQTEPKPDPKPPTFLLNEKQVSELYGLNVKTLQAWRHRGGGPEYVKISRRMVLYRPTDVERWIAEHMTKHTAMPTTAERAAREMSRLA